MTRWRLLARPRQPPFRVGWWPPTRTKTYIALIAQKRQVEVNVLARDTAVAQLDYAKKRLNGGMGIR